ncbi:MAG: hypothetical protein ACKOW9_04380, partial [Candidatus Paceibacterota bacterium]
SSQPTTKSSQLTTKSSQLTSGGISNSELIWRTRTDVLNYEKDNLNYETIHLNIMNCMQEKPKIQAVKIPEIHVLGEIKINKLAFKNR